MSLDDGKPAPVLVQRHDAARRGALARALELAGAPAGEDDALPEGARRVRRRCGGRRRRRLHAGGAAVRRRRGGGGHAQTIRFVNIRETGGWSAEARAATPKIAALLALAGLPEPGAGAARRPTGRRASLLIVGPAEAALHWARCAVGAARRHRPRDGSRGRRRVAGRARRFRSTRARVAKLAGWLGAFDVDWTQENPIDLDLCTRCNACITRLPRAGDRLQLPDRPRPLQGASRVRRRLRRDGRDRLRAARRGAQRALRPRARSRSASRMLRMHQPPQGYFAPGADPLAQAQAVTELALMIGEFEKPKYFAYKASICAHSRSQQAGLQPVHRRLLDGGDRADGDHVAVEPHLCMGCGACATVCPSGAMTYAYPSVPDLGRRAANAARDVREGRRSRRLPAAARRGRPRRDRAPRAARPRAAGAGHPARSASRRVDRARRLARARWRTARARSRCSRRAPRRRNTARRWSAQMRIADTIAQALGYQGEHFRVFDGADAAALDAALWSWPAALAVRDAATFALHGRQAHDRGARDRAPRAARAGAAARDRAAGRRAVRHDRRRPRHLHDVPRLRRRVSGGRDPRQPGDAAAALHRGEVRAVRALREDVPRARDLR